MIYKEIKGLTGEIVLVKPFIASFQYDFLLAYDVQTS